MTTFVDILLAAVVIGVSVPGIVVAVRALPPVEKLVFAGTKPWACDICSCFWSVAICSCLLFVVFREPILLLAAGPAYTLSLFLLSRLQSAPSLPPPELVDSGGLAEKLEGP